LWLALRRRWRALSAPRVPFRRWVSRRWRPFAPNTRGSRVEFEATDLIDAGDTVFAWIRIAGRGVGSGIPVAMEQAQVWMFRDGKVVRVEEYFDRGEGLRAAGLSED
jgi:ketosteroid isomerase-like protein